MAWARIDDGFHDHPKVDDLSLAAIGLWTVCLTWAHRHRRTAAVAGHVTEARARKAAGKQWAALTEELVSAQLWEVSPLGGWEIHDFGDYLPKQRDSAEASEAGKRGAAKRWHADTQPVADSYEPGSSVVAADSTCASAPASPSRPVPSQPPTASVVTPRQRGHRLPLGWEPSVDDITWARGLGVSDEVQRRQTERFTRYWRAKAGKDATKLDWSATWRNWIDQDADRSTHTTKSREQQATDDMFAAAGKRMGVTG